MIDKLIPEILKDFLAGNCMPIKDTGYHLFANYKYELITSENEKIEILINEDHNLYINYKDNLKKISDMVKEVLNDKVKLLSVYCELPVEIHDSDSIIDINSIAKIKEKDKHFNIVIHMPVGEYEQYKIKLKSDLNYSQSYCNNNLTFFSMPYQIPVSNTEQNHNLELGYVVTFKNGMQDLLVRAKQNIAPNSNMKVMEFIKEFSEALGKPNPYNKIHEVASKLKKDLEKCTDLSFKEIMQPLRKEIISLMWKYVDDRKEHENNIRNLIPSYNN